MRRKRKIKKALVDYISLCPRGANKLPVMYKSEEGDDRMKFTCLTRAEKDFEERGLLTAVVYAKGIRDSQGDIVYDDDVIYDMMTSFAKNGRGIDIRHDEKALSKDDIFPVESFQIQENDPRFADYKDYDGNPVDVTGGWGVVFKVENEGLREAYREGKWNGVSMGGSMLVESEKHDSDVNDVVAAFQAFLKQHTSPIGSDDMTNEEMLKAVQDSNTALLAGVGKELDSKIEAALDARGIKAKKADDTEPQPEPAKKEAPKFTGEPTAENIKAFRLKTQKQAILDSTDWTDAEAAKKAEDSIRALDEEAKMDDADVAKKAGVEDSDSATVRELKIRLHKEQARSQQGTEDNKVSTQKSDDVAEEDAMAKEMVAWSNKQRGVVTADAS